MRYDAGMADAELIALLDACTRATSALHRVPGLRVRHVVKSDDAQEAGRHVFMLFNETQPPVEFQVELPVPGPAFIFDPWTGATQPLPPDGSLTLPGHAFTTIVATDAAAP